MQADRGGGPKRFHNQISEYLHILPRNCRAPIVLSLTVHPEPPHYSQVSTEKSKECQAFSQEQENASLAAMGKLSRPSA